MVRWLRWLVPGLQVKRWLLVFAVGIFLMGLGISLAFQGNLYAQVEHIFFRLVQVTFPASEVYPITTAILVAVAGGLLAFTGMYRIVRAVLETLASPAGGMAETFYQKRSLLRGPKVVSIGGGTGIPTLLRGLKEYTSNLSAVVTVADDGGSSGRLRSEFGILPPGDIRNSLVALADTEPMMEKLFQYRFTNGDGLTGHPFGNLFILAMTEATGNFYDAVRASSQVLAIRGRVMPSTLAQVTLQAELADGSTVEGESAIGSSPARIKRVCLKASDNTPITALPDAAQAIREADLIVLGPGSLYTSIIPNLLVPGIADAIRQSRALKVYVCNIMTQPGETDGYAVSDHVKALVDHAGYGLIDICLVNATPVPEQILRRYQEQGAGPVGVDPKEAQRLGVAVVQADLLETENGLVRHNSKQVARQVMHLTLTRRSHLERTPWDYFWLRQKLQRQDQRRG